MKEQKENRQTDQQANAKARTSTFDRRAKPKRRRRITAMALVGLLFCVATATAVLELLTVHAGPEPVPPCTPPTGLIISEFRLRGAAGPSDEFIEFYNNSDSQITVCTADGSNGWALVSSEGVIRFVIPSGTVIPARAHYLAVGSGYGLASYAAGDLSYAPDTPDNLGLALFNTASSANLTTATRLDAVGFTTTTNSLYREGAGLPTLMPSNGQYSFVRKLNSGFPQDTANNPADFTLVATDGGNYGIIAVLGAPGPEGLNSPLQRNAQLPAALLDPAVSANVAPNRVRVHAAVGPNAAAGTLTIRRTLINNSGGAVTQLRVRIVDITTLNSPGYVAGGSQADVRALNSNDTTVTLSNGTQVLVRGTTVETPPLQPNAGGLNASMGVFAYSLSQPLAPGASAPVQFVLGVQQSGTFRFFVNIEAMSNSVPSAIAGGPYSGPTGSPIQFNGSGSHDLEGPVENYQWNFGDYTTGTGPAPSHTYSSAGTYTVTLTVTDNIGLTTSGTTTATIYPASNMLPVANIGGPYSTVTGTATQFSSSSFDPDGSIIEYKWDFAGQGTGTGPTPSFTFTNTGTHLVSLTVTDNLGAKSWTSINVSVGVPPGGGQQAVGDSDVSDWDPFNRPSLDDPLNHRGNSANTTTGNNNFQLVAPVLSLPGRGMELNLNMVHNSQVWNKSGNNFYYDIDHDWPAPGWHLGFGKMVVMGTAGCLMIEPDGTRHSFKGTVFNQPYPATGFLPATNIPAFKGETTDGSMIEYRCEMQVGSSGQPYGVARYPDGTMVFYTNYSTDFSKPKNYIYPYKIVDRNGNYISIKYHWDLAEPRLERVVDSVGRVISFHYDTQKRLTAITGPGLKDANGNPTTYTFVRLHYSTQTLNLSGAFAGTTHVRNASPAVLDAIYYPATGSGFWFGPDAYTSYGVLKKVTQQRGMSLSVSPSTPFEQGTVTQGTVTRIQTYDYPATPQNLSAAPAFNSISETWDGSTTSAVTNFVSQDNGATSERTVTITNPDQTKTIGIAFSLNSLPDSDPNKFKNGLTKEERTLDQNGNVIQRTMFTWEPGVNGTPRLQRTETTDERGQILATAYDQYGDNNAVRRVREFDYSGAVFRTTVNTFHSYLDADLDRGINPTRSPSNIYHPRLVNLVASTKVFQGDTSANVLATYVVSEFDNYPQPLKAYPADGESSADLFVFGESQQPGGIIGILHHVATFNPSPLSQTDLNGGFGENYLTKRGNVTSVTRYADTSNPSAPASPIVVTMKYDMAGNLISSSSTCCEETSSNFDNLAHQYAFAVSQTRGSADSGSLLRITTSASYDLSTGLPLVVTNANGRLTETSYFSNSLRPKEIISPTGARVIFEYDDAAMKVVETTRLSASGTIASQTTKYFNGLGQVKREEALSANGVIDIVETLYDQHGRLWKQSRPYRNGDPLHPQWKETLYDAAGRVSQSREPALLIAPDDDESQPGVKPTTQYFYNEPSRPAGASSEQGQTRKIVDPWGRWRWVRLDSNGRIAEVVEPNPAGGNGFATKYFYNTLGKLVRIEQGDQVRRFRYDSIGRLTHQKLAEASATLNSAGEKLPEAEMWSDVFTYDQRSNMTSHTDARGVKTNFSYQGAGGQSDPLNRLQSISFDLSRVDSSLTVLPAASVAYQYRTKTSPAALIDVTQVKQVTATGVSTEDFDYDIEGRLQEKRLTFSGRTQPMTLTYGYDNLGRMSQITYPQQYQPNGSGVRKIVTPGYDVSSRMDSLQVDGANYASQINYNASSQITSLKIGTGPNQIQETYSYEPASSLLETQTVSRGTTTLLSLGYQYQQENCDGPGLCGPTPEGFRYTGQLTRVANAVTGQTQHFSYDSLGRLISADQGGFKQDPYGGVSFNAAWTQSYAYDRYGNRSGVSVTNASGTPAVPADGVQSLTFDTQTNRITTSGFTYDDAGNQLANGTGKQFIYDAAGRLAKVKNQSGITVETYTYGASNNRLITQTGDEGSTTKTYYIWHGDSVVTEYTDPSGAAMPQWSKNYIHFGARLLATQKLNGSGGEIVHYHHPDRLGTRLVTNNADTTYFQQVNLPFGTELDTESTGETNRRFTSYDRSDTTGVDYAINRQYDSRQGRFTQIDPLGIGASSLADPQSLNMYTYVGNDPVNRVDPDGQFWGSLFRFIGGLFRGLRPNVINGSFAYGNRPPISVSFTTNFQNIGVAYGGFGIPLRSGGLWLPQLLDSQKITETVRYPLVNFKKLLSDTLAYGDCGEFMSRLIAKTGELMKGRNNPVSTDIMTLYRMINRQPRGGFHLNHSGPLYMYWGRGYERQKDIAGGRGAAGGNWSAGNRTIWIYEAELPSGTTLLNISQVPYQYALAGLEELWHVAGEIGIYQHEQMNEAAGALEPGMRFNDAMKKHCIPRNALP